MKLYESWLQKLIQSWKTKKQAVWILQAQFEKSGIFKKWTQELTKYWKERENMTEEERAIDRIARARNMPKYKFKYVWWRVLIKNIYKK